MDKRMNGLAGALREIAEQRDNRLRNAGEIPAMRRDRLEAFLAQEFPVETALLAAARRRDESLSMLEPALPAAVHAALSEEARSVRGAAKLDLVPQLTAWLQSGGGPRAYRAAAALAAAVIIIGFAAVHLSTGNRAVRIPSESRPVPFFSLGPAAFSKISIFERSGDQLTLRPNRLELASLEPSLLTINRALPDLERPDRVLPLDLPIRQIRLDVEAVRTP